MGLYPLSLISFSFTRGWAKRPNVVQPAVGTLAVLFRLVQLPAPLIELDVAGRHRLMVLIVRAVLVGFGDDSSVAADVNLGSFSHASPSLGGAGFTASESKLVDQSSPMRV